MKTTYIAILFMIQFSVASNFCLFDVQGNCVEKNPTHDSYKNVVKKEGFKKYYIASASNKNLNVQQTYVSKPYAKAKGKKRWYEVDWEEGLKLCPEKKTNASDGVWIVNGPAHVDSLNCVYVDGSPYTRSILVLFSRNPSDLTEADSNWVLVNQTIVELAGKTFKIWDSYYGDESKKNKIREVSFQYDLIVDKTEFRIKDAIWLRKKTSEMQGRNPDSLKFNSFEMFFKRDFARNFYPFQDSINNLNYPAVNDERYVSIRSQIDLLNPVWNSLALQDSAVYSKKQKGFVRIFENNTVDFWDTTANGYRYPLRDEWIVLQNGGSSTIFPWGNKPDEMKLSRYMNINCSNGKIGVYSVKSFEPNRFGLYDVYGNAEEVVMSIKGTTYGSGLDCNGYEDSPNLRPSCRFIKQYVCIERGKPYLKDSPFVKGLKGFRLVRKLE